MADTTSRYGWPYQEVDDPPDGAGLGQDLAEAVEASVGDIDDRLDDAETAITAIQAKIGRPRFLGAFTLATLSNNSVTTLSIASASPNVGSMWTSGTNVTIPSGQGGEYEAGVLLRFATNATNRRQLRINVNGTPYVDYTVNAVASFNTSLTVAVPVVLAAGDVVTFSGYQDSGGSLALVTANNICWLNKVVQ